MAYAYRNPKSGSFLAGYKDRHGKDIRKTVPARTLTEARRLAEDLERREFRIAKGLETDAKQAPTVAEACALYVESKPSEFATRRNLQEKLRYVSEGLGALRVDAVTPADVQRLLSGLTATRKGKPMSPRTREHIRVNGQGLFSWLADKALLVSGPNPFKVAGAVKVPHKEVRYFEAAHLPRLLAELKPHHRALVAFAVLTGCRPGEVRTMLKDSIREDASGPYALVKSSGRRLTTKAGKERRAPLAAVLLPVIEEQLATPGPFLFPKPDTDGKPFSADWRMASVISRACRRAGLPADLRFKHLRHTFGTLAYEKTGDIRLVANLMGHAGSDVTEKHYARQLPASLHRGANAVASAAGVEASLRETRGSAGKTGQQPGVVNDANEVGKEGRGMLSKPEENQGSGGLRFRKPPLYPTELRGLTGGDLQQGPTPRNGAVESPLSPETYRAQVPPVPDCGACGALACWPHTVSAALATLQALTGGAS